MNQKELGPRVFLDADFSTGKECKYHCSPTCHPGQVGPDWKYGCLHPSLSATKEGDFCPFVKCEGKLDNCELDRLKQTEG